MQSTRNILLGSMVSKLEYAEDITWLSVGKLFCIYRELNATEITSLFMGIYVVLGH